MGLCRPEGTSSIDCNHSVRRVVFLLLLSTEVVAVHFLNQKRGLMKLTNKTIIIFLIAAHLFLIGSVSLAAEISLVDDNEKYKTITIKGTIVSSDFERFKGEIFNSGKDIQNVFIASNGGDVSDAMKIGSLIRNLNLSTKIPENLNNTIKGCKDYNIEDEYCTCQSACFFIYAGGISRDGDVIGVHRAFLKEEFQREIDAKKAISISKEINSSVSDYLIEMSVPRTIIDKVLHASSDEVKWISQEDVKDYLTGYIPELKDWLIASCGSFDQALNEGGTLLKRADRGEDVTDLLRKKSYEVRGIQECYKSKQSKLTIDVYKDLISSSFGQCSNVPTHPDILNLIGKGFPEAVEILKCYGIAGYFMMKKEPTEIMINGSKMLAETIGEEYSFPNHNIVLTVFNNTVKGVEVYYGFGYEYDIFNGIGAETTPLEISQKLGNPHWSDIYEKGTNEMSMRPEFGYVIDGVDYHFKAYRSGQLCSVSVRKKF